MPDQHWGEFSGTDRPDLKPRWKENQARISQSRGLSEDDYTEGIFKSIEQITGPLSAWQKFWMRAILSGRRVEWTQTRRGPHYHIVGLPCSICGGR